MSSTPIHPNDGPVSVTGSAGFIGSHIVLELVKSGYAVRACVRDATNLANTAHLSAMNQVGPGSVTLHTCDMTVPGAYDEVFRGCVGIFHAAAEMGNLSGSTPQKVYEGGLAATRGVMDSIKRAGSVRRLVYTSSISAVLHPADEGHLYTEASWADMNRAPEKWNLDVVNRDREVAYAMTKVETERYVYDEADRAGFAAFGVCPCHVVGPLLSASHQRPWAWQTRIGDMLEGYGHPRLRWNVVDVRDVAITQRLIAESTSNRNGERYNLVCKDERGLVSQPDLQAMLRRFYPGKGIAGDYREGRLHRWPVAFLEKVVTQLGHEPFPPEASVRDTADSLLSWGLVVPRDGVDNWQRDGNDLGIPSKWNPHLYPAVDPAVRAKLQAAEASRT
jgi:nucleoside-diphosphate-sugar epimerase